ncbi:MAG: YihY family inner membrane protein [Deltaproteobacteria bacterium]|nr:YihY family inner membrane protein [Deltaproteobacteria bacterium]
MRALAPLARRFLALPPVRILVETFRRFHVSRAGHMASNLSFQTLVSIVPVLLFMVGILKRFLPGDPGRDLHSFMSAYLVPDVALHVTDMLLEIIENFNFAALGWIGAIGTFLATYMLVLNLKSCLNDLGFKSSRSGFFKRLGWVTLVVVLIPPLGWLIAAEGRVYVSLPSFMAVLRPYVSTVAVIFLAYRLLPDRGPTTQASLLSASLIGLLLEMEKVGLAYYVKQVQGVYELVYGTLMFLPLMLAWLFLSWCLLLFGASLAASIDEVTGRRKHTALPPPPDR